MSAPRKRRHRRGTGSVVVYSTNTVVARRQSTGRAGIARVAAGTIEGGSR